MRVASSKWHVASPIASPATPLCAGSGARRGRRGERGGASNDADWQTSQRVLNAHKLREEGARGDPLRGSPLVALVGAQRTRQA
eukprot:8469170-Pyramimonas_sp.AAC.1